MYDSRDSIERNGGKRQRTSHGCRGRDREWECSDNKKGKERNTERVIYPRYATLVSSYVRMTYDSDGPTPV